MRKKRQLATLVDDWAWTFIYELDGSLVPVVGALVDDLRERSYIDVPPYRITMKLNKFLHRKLIQ